MDKKNSKTKFYFEYLFLHVGINYLGSSVWNNKGKIVAAAVVTGAAAVAVNKSRENAAKREAHDVTLQGKGENLFNNTMDVYAGKQKAADVWNNGPLAAPAQSWGQWAVSLIKG